jgi:hypothetical protein
VKYIEPVIKIPGKILSDRFFQILVGGGNQTDVVMAGCRPPLKLPF